MLHLGRVGLGIPVRPTDGGHKGNGPSDDGTGLPQGCRDGAGRVGVGAHPQDHIEENHSYRRVCRLLQKAVVTQRGVDHGVWATYGELVFTQVDNAVFPAVPGVGQRILLPRARVGPDGPQPACHDPRPETSLIGERERVLVHTVTVAGEHYAYILVWQVPGAAVNCEITTVEQAGLVVALEISKQRAVAEVERRFQISAVEDLVQGRIDSRAAALARGELFGWDLSGTFAPVLVQVGQLQSMLPAAPGPRGLARLVRRLRTLAHTAAGAHAPGSVVVEMGSRILVLLRVTAGTDRALARQTALSATARLVQELAAGSGSPVSAGIGRPVDDILQLGRGYRQAVRALEVGALVRGPNSVVHFDDLGVYRILAEYGDRRELEDFCEDILAELVAEPGLLETLETALNTNGNLRQAARELFIHYNTLRYRIRRIEALTGLDLSSGESRLSLQVAVKILKMRQGRAAQPL